MIQHNNDTYCNDTFYVYKSLAEQQLKNQFILYYLICEVYKKNHCNKIKIGYEFLIKFLAQ